MTMVLDAGALVAAERRPGGLIAILNDLAAGGDDIPVVPASVVAQVWRGGRGRQARLGAWLDLCTIVPLDFEAALRVGLLLAATRTTDVVDAHVIVCATDGDWVVTTDPIDLARLAKAANKQLRLIAL